VGGKVLGCVLNDVNFEKESYYHSSYRYYHHYYYHAYAEEDGKKPGHSSQKSGVRSQK
jgi:hypothetical protein